MKLIKILREENFPILSSKCLTAAWLQPRTDSMFIDNFAAKKLAKKVDASLNDVRAIIFLHEVAQRIFYLYSPFVDTYILSRANWGIVSHLDKLLKNMSPAALKEMMLTNAIICRRIYLEVEPMVEAYTAFFLEKDETRSLSEYDDLIKKINKENLKVNPEAKKIYEKMNRIDEYCKNPLVAEWALKNAINYPKVKIRDLLEFSIKGIPIALSPKMRFEFLLCAFESVHERTKLHTISTIRNSKKSWRLKTPAGQAKYLLPLYQFLNEKIAKLANVETSETRKLMDPSDAYYIFMRRRYRRLQIPLEERKYRNDPEYIWPSILLIKEGKKYKHVFREDIRKSEFDIVQVLCSLNANYLTFAILNDKEICCYLEKYGVCVSKKPCSQCGVNQLVKNAEKLSINFQSHECPELEAIYEDLGKEIEKMHKLH